MSCLEREVGEHRPTSPPKLVPSVTVYVYGGFDLIDDTWYYEVNVCPEVSCVG